MIKICVLASVLAMSCSSAFAEVTVSKVIPGYRCMSLNLTDAQMADPSVVVEIKSAPNASAPNIGTASAIVVTSSPLKVENGFARVLHLNGKTGWIPVDDLRPWRAADGGKATCVPAIMSNGRIGFDIH
jgi:hypothetical protein